MTDNAHDALLRLIRENPPERYRTAREDWHAYMRDIRALAQGKRWTNWTDELKEEVLKEGGRWPGKRAMEYLHSIGFDCTIHRARVCMEKIAKEEPDRVQVVEGHRWIWEVR